MDENTENNGKKRTDQPNSILFVCNFNAVRSPMAECIAKSLCGDKIYIDSFGVNKKLEKINSFAVSALEEIGLDITNHKAKHYEDLLDTSFDLIITLSADAHEVALKLTSSLSAEVEYWPTNDPTSVKGNRENIMSAFRAVRDELSEKIKKRLVP